MTDDKRTPTDELIDGFAAALKEKLNKAREKYGYQAEGWQVESWMFDCQDELLKHLAKGDPCDVAAYCAFMWHHGWSTKAALQQPDKTAYEDLAVKEASRLNNRCNEMEKALEGAREALQHYARDEDNKCDFGGTPALKGKSVAHKQLAALDAHIEGE